MKLFICFLITLMGFFSFSQGEEYELKNLNINNEYPHFSITPLGENQVVFSSYKLTKKGKLKIHFANPILTIYKAKLGEGGEFTDIEELPIEYKYGVISITSAALSDDEKYLYIATTYTSKNKPKGKFKEDNYHIEVGEYKAGIGYTDFKVLPFCLPRYSYAHPSLSRDGKILYFTSNHRGGRESTKGGSDIFKVEVLNDNTYGAIKNLGIKVNSYGKEMFPIEGFDKALYYATNRPNGFGGFDIYRASIKEDGTFNKAEKLPKPINSAQDDFSLIMQVDRAKGYLVSKQDGGKGQDDIYYFEKQ